MFTLDKLYFSNLIFSSCGFFQPPFVGNRQKVQQKIIKDKIKLPAFLSSDAHSLLKGVSYISLYDMRVVTD